MSELFIGKHLDSNGVPSEPYRHRLSDLITHTFICGGSGSGKTVMGKAIIEESALQGVPAIVVDLKGDLSSLALAFGELTAPAIAPWIEVEDPSTRGRTALAEANIFRKRLWEWGLAETHVRTFFNQVAVEIFTPRSELGRRVSIPLIATPPPDIHKLFEEDPDTASVMVTSMAEALVRRVIPTGQRDRETDFVIALIEHAWHTGIDLTGETGLGRLVSMILEPPFSSIGVLGIDDHIPENRRQKLAQAVNGQLVGAAANWVRGEEMRIDKLAGTHRVDGKTQISIINLSHMTNFEDQSFVVAQTAFSINAWMRKQGSAPAGNRPRLIFFLDEIGGGGGKTAFYPTYPYTSTCKPALNLLVKQGRGFGVGCILATQNPGDIDYKGLSNCATWIVGKLQTRRDRDKVREGLTDAAVSPSDLARKLARPKTGEFMLLNKDGGVHFIRERWLLTYHCTMSPEQLRRYKTYGLAPYEGALNTDIAAGNIEGATLSDEQEEILSLWNDAKDAVGQACSLLHKILDHDPSSEKAHRWISILRDPDGFHRQLQEAQRQLAEHAEAACRTSRTTHPMPGGLLGLLCEKKSTRQSPPFSDTRTVSNPVSSVDDAQPIPNPVSSSTFAKTPPVSASGPLPGERVFVEADGSVTCNGQKFQLYRRYAGKSVTFIAEDGELKFVIDGKILAKSYRLTGK